MKCDVHGCLQDAYLDINYILLAGTDECDWPESIPFCGEHGVQVVKEWLPPYEEGG